MKQKLLLIIIVGMIGFVFYKLKSMPPKTDYYEITPVGGEFFLTSKNGLVKLSDSNGKVRLLYFGFTTCPDICPTTLSKLKNTLKNLTEDQRKLIQFIFITVDPERDEIQKLASYVEYFDPSFIALTGTIDEIKNVAKKYGAYFNKTETKSQIGYTMDHTTSLFLIDKSGAFLNTISLNTTQEELKEILMKEIIK